MFGFVQVDAGSLSEEEMERYRATYCGLCFALKERHGQLSRFCLTYDLTFYVMLCHALHEPPERAGKSPCIAQPGQLKAHVASGYSDHAADLSVMLAYHKLLDDWNDDRKVGAKVASAALTRAYERARQAAPADCAAIERSLEAIARIEADAVSQPDDAAIEFGKLMGNLFARGQGTWEQPMRELGFHLGRFVYFMDAAVDYEDDRESGSYNPLVRMGGTPESMRLLLASIMAEAAAVFEKLPLDRDLNIMRSILYAGAWAQFNEAYGTSSI